MENKCVNCFVRIIGGMFKSIRSLDISSQTILTAWVHPFNVSDANRICLKCHKIIAGLTMEPGSPPQRMFGHRHICYSCGTSILNKRSHAVLKNSAERDLFLQKIPMHQVHLPHFTHACHNCWRNVKKQQQNIAQGINSPTEIKAEMTDTADNNIDIDMPQDVERQPQNIAQDTLDSPTEIKTQMTDAADNNNDMPQDPLQLVPLPLIEPPPAEPINISPLPVMQQEAPKIISGTYKRVAATSRHCIFKNCLNAKRLLVPYVVREMLLLDFKLYIPQGARICEWHLNIPDWDTLEAMSVLRDFTAFQVDDMLAIMAKRAKRNINNRVVDSERK